MPKQDPIVAEVRRARQRHARKHNYDLKAIYRDLKEWERTHVAKTVKRSPKPPLRGTGT